MRSEPPRPRVVGVWFPSAPIKPVTTGMTVSQTPSRRARARSVVAAGMTSAEPWTELVRMTSVPHTGSAGWPARLRAAATTGAESRSPVAMIRSRTAGWAVADIADPGDESTKLVDGGGDLGSGFVVPGSDVAQNREVAVEDSVDGRIERFRFLGRAIGEAHQLVSDATESGDHDNEGTIGALVDDDGPDLQDAVGVGDGASSEFENSHGQLANLRRKFVARVRNARSCSSRSAVSMRKASWPCGERSQESSPRGASSAISNCSAGG